MFLTPEAQVAMLSLIKRARGKRVEYGLQLLLEDDKIYPGKWKWGWPEKILGSFLGIGWFHTHPDPLLRYRHLFREPLAPEPLELSQVDILHIFVSPEHRIMGVGGTETFMVKLVPYGTEESSEVKFVSLVKPVPVSLRAEVLRMLPWIMIFDTPVEGLEGYYELYTFDLTSTRSYPMEVYLG